jgi:hypothetical protein
VRLLVYGGNQHGERRRIGVWPEAVGSHVFQDTYGSSMRSASFGVGILDHSPFLILRKIENFGERAYPLVVLFDPGREAWTRFNWNGAHLLWTLFGKIDYPGLKLLTEPESYHTDEHLEKLLSEVDESGLPQPEGEEIKDPAQFLDLWSGAVFAKAPLIAQVDPQLTGFSNRPDLRGLADLLSKLPSALRCGNGWLFGGRDRHAESLGAGLVFDDGKPDAPKDSDRELLAEYQRQGHDLRAALETLNESTDDENSGLKQFLSKPVFEWTDQSVEALPQLLHDILLIRELNARAKSEVVIVNDELDKRFARVNKRLNQAGQLNGEIAFAANSFLEQHGHTRTEQETLFILTQLAGQPNPKIKDNELSNLKNNAAYSFFVDRKIFPAEATGWMPREIRLDVCKKLLETEDRTEKIPEIFRKEADTPPGYESQELEALLDAAVQRSAETVHGLRFWSALFEHPTSGKDVQRVVRTRVLHQVAVDNPDSLADYLLLGDDAGGEKIVALKPVLKETGTLEDLVRFITEQIEVPLEPELDKAAKQWLSRLSRSGLRLEISLRAKDHLTERFRHGWENYVFVRRAYTGDRRLSKPSRIADDQERRFLAQELATAAADAPSSPVNFIPALDHLAKILAPDCLGALVEALIDLRPNFNAGDGMSWVEGWLRLAQHKSDLDQARAKQCLDKYGAELVRLIFETKTFLKGREQLDVLSSEHLTHLFRGLLTTGNESDDDFLRLRLLEVLNTLRESKEFNQPIQHVFDEVWANDSQREQLTRRLLGQQPTTSALKKRLTPAQRDRFKALFEEQSSQAVKDIKNSLLAIFSSGDPASALGYIGQVHVRAKKFGGDVFKQALTSVFEEVMTDQKLQDAFLSGGASSSECFQFYKQTLTQQTHKKILNYLDNEKKKRERIAKIERFVLRGGADRDKEYKKDLRKLLEDHPDDSTRETLDRVLKQALSASESFKIVVRRFVPIGPFKMVGHQSLEIKYDNLFNTLFDFITPETSREFLRELWKYFHAEHGDDNPLINSACEVLKTIVDKGHQGKRGSNKQNQKPYIFLNPFPNALLNFLAYSASHRRQMIEIEFDSERIGEVEDLMRQYVPDVNEEDEIPQSIAESASSLGDRFRRGWKKMIGRQ